MKINSCEVVPFPWPWGAIYDMSLKLPLYAPLFVIKAAHKQLQTVCFGIFVTVLLSQNT